MEDQPDSISNLLRSAREPIVGQRVFGEAVTENGVTVIPAAHVAGCGGGGGGEGEDEAGKQGAGAGAGFAVRAKPAGVYVIDGDQVSWRPAVNVNAIVLSLLALVAIALLTRD